MNLSVRVLLAPVVGALLSWLASRGLTFTPDQQTAAVALGSSVLTWLAHAWHQWSLPGPTLPPPVSGGKQSGRASLALLLTLALGLGVIFLPAGCKTLPNATAQAGIAAAVDIAAGLAIQQGSTDPAVWKTRAAGFEAAAKALAAVNAAGPTSLQTLMADLQPHIAKLGPADVLAANALVAALTPIIQQQLGTNPSLANTQAEISLVLQDVIAACAAYTGS